jgi:hypothetical protein
VTGWGALGFLTGVVAGMALGAWAGGVNRERLGRAARRISGPSSTRPQSPAAIAIAAREAIAAEPDLAALTLEVAPIGRRAVELRGWVDRRSQRTQAARAVRQVSGVETLVNSIRVRGEDDRPLPQPTRSSKEPA